MTVRTRLVAATTAAGLFAALGPLAPATDGMAVADRGIADRGVGSPPSPSPSASLSANDEEGDASPSASLSANDDEDDGAASPVPAVRESPSPSVPATRSETDVVAPPPETRTSPEGFTVAGGTGPVVGDDGPVRTYTVEVEPPTGQSIAEILPVVTAAMEDTARGWTARGERRFQRIEDPAAAHVRVVLASPDTVDTFCARVGARTVGIYSCWDGARAMLNLYRWEHGASDFADLAAYRRYLVNHEVGHSLAQDHVGCPAPGVPAPIMMQQTKTVGDCLPNGWPYP